MEWETQLSGDRTNMHNPFDIISKESDHDRGPCLLLANSMEITSEELTRLVGLWKGFTIMIISVHVFTFEDKSRRETMQKIFQNPTGCGIVLLVHSFHLYINRAFSYWKRRKTW